MKRISFFVFCSLSLVACDPAVVNRGNILDGDNVAMIKVGSSTREDVASTLGTPTNISTFDEKVWYYIGRQTQQYSFLSPEVMKQQAVEIDFDDAGVVKQVKNLDLTQASDIDPVDRSTPTYGREGGLLRELLGDLSHPMPDLKNQTRGGGGT